MIYVPWEAEAVGRPPLDVVAFKEQKRNFSAKNTYLPTVTSRAVLADNPALDLANGSGVLS
jgi:hypothetical protein